MRRSRLVAVIAGVALVIPAACTDAPDPSASESSTTSPATTSPPAVSPSPSRTSPTSPSASPSSAGTSPTTTSTAGAGEPGGDQAPGIPESARLLPSAAELAEARADVSRLTDRQLAGQLVVGTYDGDSPAAAAALVRRHHLAGVIVMGPNVPRHPESRRSRLRALAAAVQAEIADSGRAWPAVISVDQEGGPVERVGAPVERFPSLMALGASDSADLAREWGHASGSQLADAGFTLVFAPVADVTIGPEDPAIGVRSIGSDPARVAQLSAALTRGYLDSGVIPAAKHFPGHGSLSVDSHHGLPVLDRSLAELEERDLAPFRAQIATGVPVIMAGHIVLAALDSRNPATLSKPVLTGLLREKLGFRGVITTDAMNMGAITKRYGASEAAVRAVESGVDLVLMPSSSSAVDALAKALQTGRLDRDQVEESAARVVATLRRGEIVRRSAGWISGQSARAVAARAAGGAITQLSGTCGARLVGDSISVSGATAADREALRQAAADAGLGTDGGTSVVLLGGGAYFAGDGRSSGAGRGRGDIVVALDVPYGLGASRARVARLATFGRTEGSFDALVEVLLGQRAAPGHLPVPVEGYPHGSGCP